MARQGNPPGRYDPRSGPRSGPPGAPDEPRVSSDSSLPPAADGQSGADHDLRDSRPDSDASRVEPAPHVAPREPEGEALSGQPHGQVYFVLHTYVTAGHEIEIAPLAREPEGRAHGSDIRVRKSGVDPATGDRPVEELAFAIESPLFRAGDAMERHAQALAARGVRRVFAIGAGSTRFPAEPRIAGRPARPARRPGPLREWAPARSAWRTYNDEAVIADPCLAEPVPVRALLDAVEADRAVARALIDRGVDVIEEYGTRRYDAGKDDGYRAGTSDGYRAGKDEGYRAGKDDGYRAGKNDGYRAGTNDGYRTGASDGMREAILLLLRARGLELDEHAYARIAACSDMSILQRWLTRAVHVVSPTALFDDA